MKIGILTFHRTTNYGAALQAYALQQILKKMGHNIKIIDYNNKNVYSYYDYRIFYGNQSLKTRIGKVIRYPYNKKICGLFGAFRKKRLDLSQECRTLEELSKVEEKLDAVICGSDQVWNPRAIFEDFDAYLLGTAKCKKIAYAASAGNISLWEKYLNNYWTLLHRFDAISVREKNMRTPTEHLSQKNVELVLDPSLLLEPIDWIKLENTDVLKTLPEKEYIFVYFLGNNSFLIRMVKELKYKTGLTVVSLGHKIKGIKTIRPIVGPREFIALIHNASYVLTSSFHGTAFSIIFNRPFLVFGNGEYNSRMITLLSALNLQNRMISTDGFSAFEEIKKTIDWEQTEKFYYKEKKKSIDFLKKALEEKGDK